MEVIFLPDAEDDLLFWASTGNKPILKKIVKLIENIKLQPYHGLGKPEPLKHNLAGCWSRRIDKGHRLIYEVKNETILILSAKGHYS